MTAIQVQLDYKRDKVVTDSAKEWDLSKHDTVLKIIDLFQEAQTEDSDDGFDNKYDTVI